MLNYRDLERHQTKYKLHPLKAMRDMHGFADPIMAKYADREYYLSQPKASTVKRQILTLPASASQASGVITRAGVPGTTLAGLGPRIKQIKFLAENKLFPPDDELNLDAWVASRLGELRQFMPAGTNPTLQNWVQLRHGRRSEILDREIDDDRVVAREREAIDQQHEDDANQLRQILSESAIPKLLLKKKRAAKTQDDKVKRAVANELAFRVLPPRSASAEAKGRIYEQSQLGKRSKDDTFEPGDASDKAFNVRFPGLADPFNDAPF